jgi:hypothetical protein
MNGHIDADGIAEFRVGLITGRRQHDIAAHLAACAQCTSVADRLAEVSTLLAAVPAPVMPDTVAARLQTALAAETAISSEQKVVKPARSRFRLPRLSPLRLLAPAAAVAVLAAGAFGLSQLGSTPSLSQAASGSAEAAPAAPSAMEGSFATGHADKRQALGSADLSDSLFATSSADLQAKTLGRQLGALFQSRSQLGTTQPSASLKSCVRTVAGAGNPVELVVSTRYRGAPATVVFVSQGTHYLGIVAGSHCSATEGDVLATAVVSPGISTP